MAYIARWPAFHITDETAEKMKRISPATIDRYLKKTGTHSNSKEKASPNPSNQ
jgi:hypothetical protein